MTIKKPFNAYAIQREHYETAIVPREEKARKEGAFMFFLEDAARSPIYSVVGSEAHIRMDDELDPEYYAEIIDSVRIAEESPEIERIVFDINSPGGTVDGVFQTAEIIRNAKKPTVARVSYLCASAAYWLASQCNEIVATADTAQIGSIGVVIVAYDFTKAYEEMGVTRHYIVSDESPKKVADVGTEEGREQLKTRINDIYGIFAEAVATGRKTTVESVKKSYGKGDVFIAEKALKAGMIDKIEKLAKIKTTPEEDEDMTLKYTEEQAAAMVSEAAKAAVDAERLRIDGHLSQLEAGAKLETVKANIKEGKSLAECSATYIEQIVAHKAIETLKAEVPPVVLPKADHAKKEEPKSKEENFGEMFAKRYGNINKEA